MKYIRTKDGKIYDLESKEVSSWEYIDNDTAINEYGVEGAFYTIYYFDENKGHYSEYDSKGGHSCDFIGVEDIIKQADTIKKLCDELIYEMKIGNEIKRSLHEPYAVVPELDYKYFTIYGAIWVIDDNGVPTLKPVAKMNDEGELKVL